MEQHPDVHPLAWIIASHYLSREADRIGVLVSRLAEYPDTEPLSRSLQLTQAELDAVASLIGTHPDRFAELASTIRAES